MGSHEWGVGLTEDRHSLNLCLGKTTKGWGSVEPSEGHHTSNSDITISFQQQDEWEDHLAYQHTPFPDSVCVEKDATLGSCLRGQAEAAPSEVIKGQRL